MKIKKIIFFAVDCQKDFINPDGALYVEDAETIKPNLKKLTEFAKENNIMVVNTKDHHHFDDEELSDKPDFINTFPKHCIVGSIGEEFIDETLIKEGDVTMIFNTSVPQWVNLNSRNIIIYKNKFCCFEGNQNTNKFLDLINPDIIVVYGVATNVCVDCAVLGLRKRGIEVIVIKDAIKELPKLSVEDIYDEWDIQGVVFSTVNEIMENLKTMTLQGINNDY